MRGILILVVAALALTGCGPAVATWADDAAVSRATYSHGEPYSVTVFTMVIRVYFEDTDFSGVVSINLSILLIPSHSLSPKRQRQRAPRLEGDPI